MKTTTNFSSKSVLRLPSLALLFAAALLPLFGSQPVLAQGEKPFHANFTTKVISVVEGEFLHITVTGSGQANYLGKTKAFTDNQLVSLIDGSGTATYTLTAADGDTLVLELVVPPGGTINVDGGVLFSGTYTINGGTGEFSDASGAGIFAGSGLFLTETDGIGAFQVVGKISR
jgi:hypothetical protein